MSVCQPIKFTGIDRLRYMAIRARVRAQAAEMSCAGDTGKATGDGITIAWSYNEGDQELTFTCPKRPWWKSEGFVSSKIYGLIEAL
jgi:hypothetical protein